jgi:hypothetical protein
MILPKFPITIEINLNTTKNRTRLFETMIIFLGDIEEDNGNILKATARMID